MPSRPIIKLLLTQTADFRLTVGEHGVGHLVPREARFRLASCGSDRSPATILFCDLATILPRDDPVTPQITLERSTDVPERSWHAPGRSRTLQNAPERRLQDAQNHCPIDKNHGFSGIRKISRLHRFLLVKVMTIVNDDIPHEFHNFSI